MKSWIVGWVLAVAVSACVTTHDPLEDYEEMTPPKIMDAPALQPGELAKHDPEQVARGRYLVELIGCATCHTDGVLIGEPRFERWLGGSRIGIAYSNPLKYRNPGVVYAPNLTPDRHHVPEHVSPGEKATERFVHFGVYRSRR